MSSMTAKDFPTSHNGYGSDEPAQYHDWYVKKQDGMIWSTIQWRGVCDAWPTLQQALRRAKFYCMLDRVNVRVYDGKHCIVEYKAQIIEVVKVSE